MFGRSDSGNKMEIENNEIRNYYEDELQMFRTGDRQPRKM